VDLVVRFLANVTNVRNRRYRSGELLCFTQLGLIDNPDINIFRPRICCVRSRGLGNYKTSTASKYQWPESLRLFLRILHNDCFTPRLRIFSAPATGLLDKLHFCAFLIHNSRSERLLLHHSKFACNHGEMPKICETGKSFGKRVL
jgi:hypothetical protein